MRIVLVTPGASGEFYCENCLRDGALVFALRRLGHDAAMASLYLPLRREVAEAAAGTPGVFFGGVNVYLQQHTKLFRRTPRWVDRLLDSKPMLRLAAKLASRTGAGQLGAETISMLRGPRGRQEKELRRLTDWLATDRADVVCLSNALLAGLAGEIRRRTGSAVVCLLEGEDQFLDALAERYRDRAWELLARQAREIDAFIVVSGYFAEVMISRLDLDSARVHVCHSGIDPEGYSPPGGDPKAEVSALGTPVRPAPPVIGFLSPASPSRGFDLLVEAFLRLREQERFRGVRLWAAGGHPAADRDFVRSVRRRLARAGAEADARLLPNLDRPQRQAFLRTLSVLAVPGRYPEPFGLYALEAMASGVPVVGPSHGGLPEILAKGGGRLCKPDDVESLTQVLAEVLGDETAAAEIGRRGRRNLLENFTADRAAGRVSAVLSELVGR